MKHVLRVVGAGGHAKVVIATARAAGWTEIRLFDHDDARVGQLLLGVVVESGVAHTLEDPDAVVVIAVCDNAARLRLASTARCTFQTLIHPSAIIDPTVVVGAGTAIFAGTVVQPDSVIGPHSIVNTGASIDHDCVTGAGCHLAPGSRLAGGVTLGDGVFIGLGAGVLPGVTIGDRAIVGAGATVVCDVEANTTVIGVPARRR